MHARAHPPTLLAGITTAISVQERMARPADYSCMLNAVFGTLVVVCAKPIARAHLRLGPCVGFRCGGYSVRTPMRIEIRTDSPLILRAFAFRTAVAPTAGLSCRCSYLIFAIACYVRLARRREIRMQCSVCR